MNKLAVFFFIWVAGGSCFARQIDLPHVFSFHLLSEPHTLDPQSSTASSGNYVIQNLRRGLTRYDNDKGLLNEGAESCRVSHRGLRVECRISALHKWSDGEKVVASDYVRSFQRLVQVENRSPLAELLFSVKNARAIWNQKMPVEKLGVQAMDDRTLRIDLETVDPELLLKMTHPALAPMRKDEVYDIAQAKKFLSTGPYRIREWKKGNRIILEPNTDYPGDRNDRPLVEALFIEDDSTALRLYDLGDLTFLRRMPAAQIPAYRHRPDFFQVPMARFDYLGFAPSLKPYPNLRKALALSLDFNNFRDLFDALGRPGCPSLPTKLYDGPVCLNFDPKKAKELYQSQLWPEGVPKQLGFSKMGGDDIQRAAEWFQGQWKKNLGLQLELTPQEQVVYLRTLKTSPPAIFRKGIGLERPSCLAGLENFAKENPENYIGMDSKKYLDIVDQLHKESDPRKVKKLCTQAIHILMDENWLIPLGEIHFTMLADPHYQGWKINSINQLDLSDLRFIPDKSQVQ